MLSVFVLEGVTEKLLTEVATVTLQVAVRPFTVLAVIVAVPFAMPFTEPLALTVATLVFELLQFIMAEAASEGVMVAVSCAVPLGFTVTSVLFSEIPSGCFTDSIRALETTGLGSAVAGLAPEPTCP